MLTVRRALLVSLCLALLAVAACGGGPTGPSRIEGATIAGIVNIDGGAAALSSAVASGLSVSVVGTNLSSPVDASGYFQITGVPPGSVTLQLRDAIVNATVALANVGQEQLIEIQVQVSGNTASIVNEVRSNTKVTLCHRTGTGAYHPISVSDSAEPAHRAHGDGKVGDPVPGSEMQVFDENCRLVGPAVSIEKSTNGEDADLAPGPTIPVGAAVTWRYVVTNTGTVNLTNVAVVDDKNVVVTCPGTTLAAGQSMTCTASGVAAAGQYRNVGTVTAQSGAGQVQASDASHYLGLRPDEQTGPKVQLCHRTGNGSYHLIEVDIAAEPAHRAHGDAKIGEAVPGRQGATFGAGCSIS